MSGSTTNPSRMRAWLAASLLATAAVTLTLLALEVVLRATGAQPPFLYQLDADVCATHLPGLATRLRTSEYDVHVAFNSAGYRGPEWPRAKPVGTLRVALLGDSFMEALQVSTEEATATLLESALQRRFSDRRVEVLNFASAGFGTTCEYLTLKNRVLAYDPDLVILAFYVGNDVYDNHPDLSLEPNTPFLRTAGDGSPRFSAFEVRDNPVKRWLRAHARVFLWTRDHIKTLAVLHRIGMGCGVMQRVATGAEVEARMGSRTRSNIYFPSSTAFVDEAWTLTDRLVGMMADETRAHGARFLAAILPTGEQFDEDAATRYVTALGDVARDQLDFSLPTRRMRAILVAHDVPFVDVRDAFVDSRTRAAELYYARDGHWTPRAHRIAAEALVPAVSALMAGPPSAPVVSKASGDVHASERREGRA